jgi:hypothetical protein
MSSSRVTPEELQALEESVDSMRNELARKKGLSIWLTSDPRYSSLHDDLSVEVVAEGTIKIGPPHLLTFTYDNYTPTHIQVRREDSKRTNKKKEDEYRDMSSSDESSSSSLEEEDVEEYETIRRVSIPSTNVSYPLDLPSSVKKGKSYGFFVIAPEIDN